MKYIFIFAPTIIAYLMLNASADMGLSFQSIGITFFVSAIVAAFVTEQEIKEGKTDGDTSVVRHWLINAVALHVLSSFATIIVFGVINGFS